MANEGLTEEFQFLQQCREESNEIPNP